MEINPNDATAHYNMGVVLSSLGRKEEAMEWYRKVIALNPNHAMAHYNMGVVL
jgi:Flp pilus assembly protein TadD